ncbi:MAG: hypothetical protein EOP85_15345 [Verrucomicrobiaceae bacterium]|nr:MAG: hypothetical protein EOP85_15345 [Verrucomicrobiaceae bacterium]
MSSIPHHDIIGYIHGRHDKLANLLERLGYQSEGASFIPPPGHRALFLGDLIDPKPGHTIPGGVRATLHTVKAMCEAGHAVCLMGNHELNAIYYHTRGRDGKWLRHHGSRNKAMHSGTLEDFPDYRDPGGEWHTVWMPWMRSLPFFFDQGGLRAVHATWYPALVERIRGKSLEGEEFMLAGADETTQEGEALEVLLRGLTIRLPDGVKFTDQAQVARNRIRARWWETAAPGLTYDQLIFPADPCIPVIPVGEEWLPLIPGYPHDAPPIFFGHYLKAADALLHPERHNVACLDHRGASDGPLVAYRWRGEADIRPEGYVTHG